MDDLGWKIKKNYKYFFFTIPWRSLVYLVEIFYGFDTKNNNESKTILLSFTYKTILLFIQRKSRSAKKALHSFIALIELKWSTSE